MKEEREELVKQVFPRLRKMCEQRSVTWGEVDLRWGITDEEKAKGQVLQICLDEIDRCRPYFICMLGERYGWVASKIPQDLKDRQPWLKEHLEKSVTELEILHGVLNNPKMADHAYFYFRDPAYIDTIPEDTRDDFLDEPAKREKLAAMKQRIKDEGLPVRENYKTPKEFGELVFKDIERVIDKRFPKDEKIDPLDREAYDHEVFAQSRFKIYIPKQEYFDRLDEHAKGDSEPLVILGESGSGKSALLSNWAINYRKAHPEDLLIMHFIGSTPASAQWDSMLRRIMGELQRNFKIQGDIPEKPEELRSTFTNWLHMASAAAEKEGRKVILILDALNQLEDREGALDLVWIPPKVPGNIRLILSTLPGRPLKNLTERGWPTMEITPLDVKEKKQLIEDYLWKLYSKKLAKDETKLVASVEQTDNPLYLRVLLEELRVFGEHFELPEKIKEYLEAQTVDDLYEKVLRRYEKDYEPPEYPGLVRDSMSLIWASRRGLSETEILGLLGKEGKPLPQAYWAPLYLAAEHSLIDRSGLIDFFHDYLRQAVEDLYLPTVDDKKTAHIRLADYFAKQEMIHRTIDEYPWQLAEGDEWQRLYDLLGDLVFFEKAWELDEYDVKRYWANIENSSSLSMVNAYNSVVKCPTDVLNVSVVLRLSKLLVDTGHLAEAVSLKKYLVKHYSQTDNHHNLEIRLGQEANILYYQNDLDGAMGLLKEQVSICRDLNDPIHLQASLGLQAIILYSQGYIDSALNLYEEQELICRGLGDPSFLQVSLGNRALLLKAKGDNDGAMELLKEQELLCRELGDPASLQASLGNQASVLYSRGDLDGAMDLLKDQEHICRELGDKASLQVSLGNQVNILTERGDLDRGMELLKEQEGLCCELNDKASLQSNLGNQANILYSRGNLNGAKRLLKEQEGICKELIEPEALSNCLNNQALISMDQGDLEAAMKLCNEQERICRKYGFQAGLQRSLRNKALLIKTQGDLDAALGFYEEEESVCRELGDLKSLQVNLGSQASILYSVGNLDSALAHYEEQEVICNELGDLLGLSTSIGNQARMVFAQGGLDRAMELHKKEESICQKLGNPKCLAISYANQALVLSCMGKPEDGLQLAEEASNIAKKHNFTALVKHIKLVSEEIKSQLG